jgi:hypothetical protein
MNEMFGQSRRVQRVRGETCKEIVAPVLERQILRSAVREPISVNHGAELDEITTSGQRPKR